MIDPYKRLDPRSEGFQRNLEEQIRELALMASRELWGTTAQRPGDLVYVPWFDTTLGKMIVNNGTAWVNLDGTAL
jgi:hypothetical protein